MDVSALESKLIEHRALDNARFDELTKRVNALDGKKDGNMSEVRNVFEPGFGTGGAVGSRGLGELLIGGIAGYAAGNGGFGGNGGGRPTIDQLDARFNSLQNQMSTDALEGQIGRLNDTVTRSTADSTIALGAGIAGVKDAVNSSSVQNQLALCNLGHSVQAGFAGVNQSILLQGAASRELALQQALDAERARATELRIALSEHKNQSGHAATQVLVQQLVNQGNA